MTKHIFVNSFNEVEACDLVAEGICLVIHTKGVGS